MTAKRPSPARSAPSRPPEAFGEAYYRRYYIDPGTRVRSRAADQKLARFVFGYMGHLGLPVRRVLDLGCGLGQWKGLTRAAHPAAGYTGVELSPYLCRKYGWEESSAAEYRGRGQFDLILCQSVMQYLGDDEARAAVANLARLCRGAVYLEIVTREDWAKHCDQRFTDGDIHLRSGAWYRELLLRHFRAAGGGLFLPRRAGPVLYELEKG